MFCKEHWTAISCTILSQTGGRLNCNNFQAPSYPIMSNADREFEYRHPWWFVVLLCLFPGYMWLQAVRIACGVDDVFEFSAPATRAAYTCLYAVIGILVAVGAIRLVAELIQRWGKISCTDTALFLPSHPRGLSRKTMSVPYAGMTKLRRTVVGQMRHISVVHAGGRIGINAGMLPRKEDLDELFDELVRRLEPFDVEVETREYLWYRPQFSLRFMLVVTAVVAAVLGFMRWLDPEFHLSDLVLVLGCTLCVLWGWLYSFASRSTRIFAIGFMLGVLLELQLVALSLGGTIPQGPYSSTMICQQIFAAPGDLFWHEHFHWLLLGGATISGILGGTALLLVWLAVRRVFRTRSNPDASDRPP